MIDKKTKASAKEIAVILGITSRRVSQLLNDGIFKSVKGFYKISETVEAYINYKIETIKPIDDISQKIKEYDLELKKQKTEKRKKEIQEEATIELDHKLRFILDEISKVPKTCKLNKTQLKQFKKILQLSRDKLNNGLKNS